MATIKLSAAVASGITGKQCHKRGINKASLVRTSNGNLHRRYHGASYRKNDSVFNNAIKNCGLIGDQYASEFQPTTSSVEERFAAARENLINGANEGVIALAGVSSVEEQRPSVQTELIVLSIPAILAQAIDPLAQFMETAYIGRLGALELASAGISISIFNIITKVFNIPLLSVATSFVAEDISKRAEKDSYSDERLALPSVSTALALSIGIGLCEASAMYYGSGVFLNLMGIPMASATFALITTRSQRIHAMASPMRAPAEHFLKLRAFGAPAVVLYQAIQGILRGFKDTRSPVICLGVGNLAAAFFFPLLMNVCGLGVMGAAISTVASQYIVFLLMLWHLNKKTALLLPNMKTLQFGEYLRSGGFLLGRTLAAVLTVTLSSSMAARQGALPMAAHQICLQVWLSASYLVDAQSAAGQALIASCFAKKDYSRVKEITYAALKAGLFTGISLAIILSLGFPSIARIFTNDAQVLDICMSGILFVGASQPVNSMAYIFDGLHYGVSDFSFAAYSMMTVGAISIAFLLYAPSVIGLPGVWAGLTIFMGLRILAGYMRLSSRNGPWWFLQQGNEPEARDTEGYIQA